MSEIKRIANQLERANRGDAWHGPSLTQVLRDIDAETAASHPIVSAHSIWEIALHIAVWSDIVRHRLAGNKLGDPPAEEDWSVPIDKGSAGWTATIDRVDQANDRLLTAILALDDRQLDEIVPGKGFSVYDILHGVVQHNLYHAGQIVMLKKASRT